MSDASVATASADRCPTCHRPLTRELGFSSWCPACEWNLDPLGTTRPQRLFERTYERVGRSVAERRLVGMIGSGAGRPRASISGLLVVVASLLVIALGLFLVAAGIWLLTHAPGLYGLIGGGLCIGIALLIRPRPLPIPRSSVDRVSHPGLFELPDLIADLLQTKRAELIEVTTEFNATVHEAGWRRRRVLSVGLPLMAVLEPRERTAVLAHEFAHFANGDLTRGFIVETAVGSLRAIYLELRPAGIFADSEGMPAIVAAPINLVLIALAQIPLWASRGIRLLSLADRQRGEYVADIRAAAVAGPAALVSGWQRAHLADMAAHVVRATSTANWEGGNLWDELVKRRGAIPESEIDRARRLDMRIATRVDATHPPTAYRVKLAKSFTGKVLQASIPPISTERFEQALREQAERVGREAIDNYKAFLERRPQFGGFDPHTATLDDFTINTSI